MLLSTELLEPLSRGAVGKGVKPDIVYVVLARRT